jgi:uncharacterized protein
MVQDNLEPKRIVAISDTHIPQVTADLPQKVWDACREADIICHAGDVSEPELIDRLRELAMTYVVSGNMDMWGPKMGWPAKREFEVNEKQIGITHGSGAPNDVPILARAQFEDALDLILFGHSHRPFIGEINGVLCVNPGSPTNNRYSQTNTFAIITVSSEIHVELVSI